MKRSFVAGFLILIVLEMFCAAKLLYAAPAPPEKLIGMFERFSLLEEKFKSGKWDEAIKSTSSIASEFKEMLPQLKKTLRGDIATTFDSTLIKLKQALEKKDLEATEACYIDIQNFLFVIMGNYEYKVPPILFIINKYILEAEYALKKRNFKRVESEMEEIGNFMYRGGSILKEKGVKHADIEEFRETIRKIRAAGEVEDVRAAQNGINTLKEMSSMFLRLF